MKNNLSELFENENTIKKVKDRLPYLFQLAELENSRAGKVGMEVGSVREKIIIALLIYEFGEENVEINIPITEPETDVKVFNSPVSIKTITGKTLGGVKLIWTVDATKAKEFSKNYFPHCDMLLVQINWNNTGGFYYIPLEIQIKTFNQIGRERYIKLPKVGTNPRGVEITKEALQDLVNDKESRCIMINWQSRKIDYNPYKRWVDLWREE
jgi:hypothetical protein